jgi:hypothetical protein
VVNLARPTPATGWRNSEFRSFLDRAPGSFDLVLMLAVLHHMLVSERVPLADVLQLASGLTRNHLVIEFIGPEDGMFRRIARGREALHAGLTPTAFEAAALQFFEIVRSTRIENSHRWLYLLKKLG